MRRDWEEKRIKDLCDFVTRGTTPKYVDFSLSKVVNQATFSKGYWDIDNIRYTTNTKKEAQIKKGDLLLASTGGGVLGKVYYFQDESNDYYADSHVTIMRTSDSQFSMGYLYYFLSNNYHLINALLAKGSTNQTELQKAKLLDFVLRIPTYSEQTNIVNYLNEKITQISTQISLLDNKRNAYLRLKKSLINRVVTNGLDPNVKLQSNKVNWLGKIPVHWGVERAKSIFEETKNTSDTGTEDLLSVSEYYGVAKRADRMKEQDEYETRSHSLIGYKICKKGDLIVNIMLAWKRGLGVSEHNGIVSPAYAVYTPIGVYSKYFHYLMRTDMCIAEFKRNSKGIIDSRLRLYTERFYNILFPVPPFEEQVGMANYLDKQTQQIDNIVSNINKQILRLQALQKSLINEVVTGERNII